MRSPLALYTYGAAFVFILGFFIHFGLEAHNTKSWKYTMPYSDSAFYWDVAKGRMMMPRCDGNPYYYEEQGTRHRVCFLTAETIGLVAKYTGIPLFWFFLAWHMLMPFAVWFVIVLCCWKLWGYPLGASAEVSMVLLLSCLLFPWPVSEVLFRFSRPMDGIAPIFLWISLLFKGDPDSKKHQGGMICASAVALWLQPFYAVFGLWITAIEYLRLVLKGERLLKPRLHLCAMGSAVVAGIFYLYHASYGENINGVIGPGDFPLDGNRVSCFLAALFFLAFLGGVVFFFGPFLKKTVTALDRLVLEWALFGVFAYGVFGPSKHQVAAHMSYFLIIMIFSLAGWIYEKICLQKEARYFSRLNALAVIVSGTLYVCNEKFFFLSTSHYYGFVARYFLTILFFAGLFAGFDVLRKAVARKAIVCVVVLLLAIVGYAKLPLNHTNRNFPFVGVYEWLKQHSQKNEVVLIATASCGANASLFFETGLKPYSNSWGDVLSRNPSDATYRYYFLRGLMLGLLSKIPSAEDWPLDQKLHFLKLDYILIPMPSPFLDAITSQLVGHLRVVYQDKRCLLWRVS